MVLEALLNPIKAEKQPWMAFPIGIIYATIGLLVSLFLFQNYASIVSISLTALVSIPLIYGAIKLEEKKDMQISDEKILIKEHGKALLFFVFLFLGYTVAFAVWFAILPPSITHTAFQAQIDTVAEINSPVTGNAFNLSGAFWTILLNNIKVLLFCLLFALLYGFGSIFILTWNASVFAVVIGSLVKTSVGINFGLFPLVLLKYSLHGIPEILAYFMAGLAGGIISIAVIRHDFGSDKFKNVLIDSVDLSVASVIVLVIAALIEVFVSPLIMA